MIAVDQSGVTRGTPPQPSQHLRTHCGLPSSKRLTTRDGTKPPITTDTELGCGSLWGGRPACLGAPLSARRELGLAAHAASATSRYWSRILGSGWKPADV